MNSNKHKRTNKLTSRNAKCKDAAASRCVECKLLNDTLKPHCTGAIIHNHTSSKLAHYNAHVKPSMLQAHSASVQYNLLHSMASKQQ